MLTRRQFLAQSGAMGAATVLAGCARRTASTAAESIVASPVIEPPPTVDLITQLLPTPDFSEDQVLRCVAGVRPYRSGGIRLEAERLGDHVVIHNYGHGGGGITLAPGCAERVLEMVRQRARPPEEVAVLGAGICGLWAARCLLDAGFAVSIYTDRMPEETTSHVAGGQWAPAGVSLDGPGFADLCRRSHARYVELLGEEFAVFRRDNYVAGRGGGGFSRLPSGVLAPADHLDRLPFAGRERSGVIYQTLLVEPPRFLRRLGDEVFERATRVKRVRFASAEELHDLNERIVVNCMGLGARDVVGDDRLRPVRGQLVHLKPQNLPYLLSHRGYIFPRSDAVVLGGTFEEGVESDTPDPRTCDRLRRLNASFFAG